MCGMRVATSCLNLSQHSVSRMAGFGYASRIYRSRSCDMGNLSKRTSRGGCCARMEAFSDEDFSKKIQEFALQFQASDEEGSISSDVISKSPFNMSRLAPVEPPDWQDVIGGSIERKASSVELPFSLRMIKRKKKKKELKQGFVEVGESACSSVKKAFSSMVFIIRELQSYTLQMREVLFYEDLQGILVRVQKEMNASFVWLFQHVFSHTPTLMLYVMILLANYSVHSMASNSALAASPPLYYTMESVSDINDVDPKSDSSSIKTFSVASSTGKMTSIGGNNGGGRKFPSIASGRNEDERFQGSVSSDYHRTVVPDGPSTTGRSGEQESVLGQASGEEELSLWNSVAEDASSMQAVLRDESLDHETMQRFVSPVTVKIESDDYVDYLKTELLYQKELLQEPSNTLLLANYAQFLYLVVQDYDRAEAYFKRAANVEPKDAEAVSKYASFLWRTRKDLWAAEETYLEAISIDPSNSYYAANYAQFLWSTGGEDTCFPLSSSDTNSV